MGGRRTIASEAPMSAEMNSRAVRRWFTEGWTGSLDLADEIFSPNLVTNGIPVGTDGPKQNNRNRLEGFPDLRIVIDELLEIDDRVVVRLTWTGTHTGWYSGVPPSGKSVRVRGLAIWRFAEGKVVEIWSVQDQFSLLQQIGAVPPGIGGAQVRS